eukprot:767870-Hanusia_phi.AAC.2
MGGEEETSPGSDRGRSISSTKETWLMDSKTHKRIMNERPCWERATWRGSVDRNEKDGKEWG